MRFRHLLLLALTWIAAAAPAADFDELYVPRIGHHNSDGRPDIYLKYSPKITFVPLDDIAVPVPTSRRELGEFVLEQDANGRFTVVPPGAGQLQALRSWPQAISASIGAGDYNLDGNLDLGVKGSGAIPGSMNAIVYAPDAANALPRGIRATDPEFRQFVKDVHGWMRDRTYFNSGFYYQYFTGNFRVAYFDCGGVVYYGLADDPNLNTCFAGCQYLGWNWQQGTVRVLRFDSSAFSAAAVQVIDQMIPFFAGAEITPAEAMAARNALSSVLGVPVGTVVTGADVATTTGARVLAGVIADILGVLVRSTGTIGGILYPSDVGDGTLTEAEVRQQEALLQAIALEIARSRTANLISLYHGTDVASALALLNGAPLSLVAATENLNWPRFKRGFYLATDYDTAQDFAIRAGATKGGGGVVILYVFTEDAFAAVTAAGGRFQRIFGKNMLTYPGYEYYIPPRAFPVFNAQQAVGNIDVEPT
jgi:hypothetical protein